MKRRASVLVASGVLAAVLAHSQSHSIDWHTIDGGGGVSAGGNYTLSGTIGQPDAGSMGGGPFTLHGGFWAVTAVPTPGAPRLRIFRTGTNSVVLAWPADASGFALQQNIALGTTNWTAVTNPVSVVDSENQVIITPPAGNRFFRLFRP